MLFLFWACCLPSLAFQPAPSSCLCWQGGHCPSLEQADASLEPLSMNCCCCCCCCFRVFVLLRSKRLLDGGFRRNSQRVRSFRLKQQVMSQYFSRVKNLDELLDGNSQRMLSETSKAEIGPLYIGKKAARLHHHHVCVDDYYMERSRVEQCSMATTDAEMTTLNSKALPL